MNPVKAKDRDGIIQALRAGVVPFFGLHHFQVGRSREIEAIGKDFDRIAAGGSATRFLIGEYGSGKTFFLTLARAMAHEKKLATMKADLAPDRRLYSTEGMSRLLLRDLFQSLATRSKPEGNALPNMIEKFVFEASQGKKIDEADRLIREKLAPLNELQGGYDFSEVIVRYARALDSGDDPRRNAAVRWVMGDFVNRTEAREALGVRTIVDDETYIDHLRVFAQFAKISGYAGLLVCMDELVNLYKIQNGKARHTNYEKILNIFNGVTQGVFGGIGYYFGGTPDFLRDPRKGLYSYEALRSRLAENSFAQGGLVDVSGPVLNLVSLSQEDVFILLQRLRHIYLSGEAKKLELTDDNLTSFMQHCFKNIGEAYFKTPRATIKSFLDLLATLEQNPNVKVSDLITQIKVEEDREKAIAGATEEEDELQSFKL